MSGIVIGEVCVEQSRRSHLGDGHTEHSGCHLFCTVWLMAEFCSTICF